MRRTSLDELQAADSFRLIVRSGSLANAARARGVNPSTLTRSLQELEQHLGTQLLKRTTRRLSLTEAGQVYLQHAERLLAIRREAHEAIASLTGGTPRGHLRVSMPVVVGERILGPRLQVFRARYPELQLELDLSDRNMPLVEAGFDLGLRIGRLQDSSLRAQRLATVSRTLVASPDYLTAHGTPQSPQDLQQHACITLGQLAGPVSWRFWRADETAVHTVQGWLHCTSPPLALTAARQGQGITRVATWVAESALRRGELVRILPEWSCDDPEHGGPGLYVVYTQGSGAVIPLKSRVFVDFVRESLAALEARYSPSPPHPGVS